MKCPRRYELGGAGDSFFPRDDDWSERGGKTTCAHCGSLHPEVLFAAIEAGETLIPTDKNYKVYVDPGHRKFYFQHLSPEEQQRFVDLLNAKKITIGDPGYFYRLPFFVRR